MPPKKRDPDPRDRGQIDPPVLHELPGTPAELIGDLEQDRLKAHARVRELEDGIRAYIDRYVLRGREPIKGNLLVSSEDFNRLRALYALLGEPVPTAGDTLRVKLPPVGQTPAEDPEAGEASESSV